MTKRIIAMALVVVFAAFALASCDGDTPATTAPATKPATTPTAPGTTPVAPGTTPVAPGTTPVVPGTTPSVTPDPTTPDDPADPFDYFGGYEKMFETAAFYSGAPFEAWPFAGNNEWAPCAFFQSCINIDGVTDGNYTENLGTDDYEYTWKWYYHNVNDEFATMDDLTGPFTSPTETFYAWGNAEDRVIYRLQVGSAPEGDMCKDLVVGETYMFLIALYKGDDCVGFAYIAEVWSAKHNAMYQAYNYTWTTHNRADGYTTGVFELTDADWAKYAEFGFDSTGAYVGA